MRLYLNYNVQGEKKQKKKHVLCYGVGVRLFIFIHTHTLIKSPLPDLFRDDSASTHEALLNAL